MEGMRKVHRFPYQRYSSLQIHLLAGNAEEKCTTINLAVEFSYGVKLMHLYLCHFVQVIMGDRASAERACKDPNPIIDGRKANVNLAILGAKPRGNLTSGKLKTFIRKIETERI